MSLIRKNERKLFLQDGTELFSDLWFPEGVGPWPALLMRQPYGKEIASTITYAHPTWWAAKGYLVVIQDVRGQGKSTGKFLGFKQELSDTSQTHSWVRNLPECNGLLGTYGFSYQGITQLLANEGTKPPDCLAPAMTGLKEYEHWSCDGGAFWWEIGLAWGLQLAAQKVKREKNWTAWHEIRKSLETNSYLTDGVDLIKAFDPKGMANNWLTQSNQSEKSWTTHQPLNEWLKKPMLLIGGWWDPHLKGIIDIYQKSIASGGDPELYIGPANHLDWWEGIQELHLNFFNKHLKEADCTKVQHTNKKIWNITNKEWVDINTFSVTANYWNLISHKGLACIENRDGLLTKSSNGYGQVMLVHDPWRPCPSKGGHLSKMAGLVDREQIDNRSDVATFTSVPFSKGFQLEGLPTLEIEAVSDTNSFDLFVALSYLQKGNSSVYQLSTGVLRLLNEEGNINTHRKISLQPIFAYIPNGAQLRVSISAAAWPAIAINSGKSNIPPGAPNPAFLVTTICLNLKQAKLIICPLLKK